MSPNPQSRRTFLKSTSLVSAGSLFLPSANAEFQRPNLVLILADDLGYGDLGCYGCPDIPTPNLDRLARDGVRLTDCYASAPVCTPTRCALMTGRYQQRAPNLEWALYPGVKTAGLPKEEITIAKILKQAGYKTALFGKWHLGYQPEWGPNQHGFDEFFGLLSGNIDYFRHIEGNGEADLYENTTPIQQEGYMTDLITQRSVDFIERQEENKPFFLYTSYNAPHWPIQGPDDRDLPITKENWSRSGARPDYAKMVERMDEGIGQILGALKKKGLEENTLVVFCSDNGGDRLARNEPLSGQKGLLKEGGIRVPCIFRWPDYLPAGRVSGQTAITMDITASLISAARLIPVRKIDGVDLFSFISGRKNEVERTFVWRNDFHNEKAIRWGHWKWYQKKRRRLSL